MKNRNTIQRSQFLDEEPVSKAELQKIIEFYGKFSPELIGTAKLVNPPAANSPSTDGGSPPEIRMQRAPHKLARRSVAPP